MHKRIVDRLKLKDVIDQVRKFAKARPLTSEEAEALSKERAKPYVSAPGAYRHTIGEFLPPPRRRVLTPEELAQREQETAARKQEVADIKARKEEAGTLHQTDIGTLPPLYHGSQGTTDQWRQYVERDQAHLGKLYEILGDIEQDSNLSPTERLRSIHSIWNDILHSESAFRARHGPEEREYTDEQRHAVHQYYHRIQLEHELQGIHREENPLPPPEERSKYEQEGHPAFAQAPLPSLAKQELGNVINRFTYSSPAEVDPDYMDPNARTRRMATALEEADASYERLHAPISHLIHGETPPEEVDQAIELVLREGYPVSAQALRQRWQTARDTRARTAYVRPTRDIITEVETGMTPPDQLDTAIDALIHEGYNVTRAEWRRRWEQARATRGPNDV
jgi:hypothetical protein